MAKLSILHVEHHKDFLSTQVRILFTTSQRFKPRYNTLGYQQAKPGATKVYFAASKFACSVAF